MAAKRDVLAIVRGFGEAHLDLRALRVEKAPTEVDPDGGFFGWTFAAEKESFRNGKLVAPFEMLWAGERVRSALLVALARAGLPIKLRRKWPGRRPVADDVPCGSALIESPRATDRCDLASFLAALEDLEELGYVALADPVETTSGGWDEVWTRGGPNCKKAVFWNIQSEAFSPDGNLRSSDLPLHWIGNKGEIARTMERHGFVVDLPASRKGTINISSSEERVVDDEVESDDENSLNDESESHDQDSSNEPSRFSDAELREIRSIARAAQHAGIPSKTLAELRAALGGKLPSPSASSLTAAQKKEIAAVKPARKTWKLALASPLSKADLDMIIPRHERWLERYPDFIMWSRDDIAGFDFATCLEATEDQGNLSRRDLRGLSLANVELRAAQLCNSIADGVDFSGASLEGALLTDVRAPNARFDGANLRGADFSQSDLRGASFRGADCSDADFEDTDLTGSDFEGAIVRGVMNIPPGTSNTS